MEVSLSVFNIYLLRRGELVEAGVLCGRSDIAKVADKVEVGQQPRAGEFRGWIGRVLQNIKQL